MSVDITKNIDEKKRMLLARRRELQRGLPHLYGFKHYKWSREVFESFEKLIFVSAANQVGKSSCAIRKAIHWATEPSLWPKISQRGPSTSLFIYMYPSLKMARREIEHKWETEFLPRGEFKEHPQYGWRKFDSSEKLSIKFNSGVEIQFLGYAQGKSDILNLAGSSPSAIFIDEEMSPELWPEIAMRVEATKGCISLWATPVKCYRFYKDIFEYRTKLENSLIRTISMYECTKFEDGSPGLYTPHEIAKRRALLGSETEIQRRIYGKYVSPEGLQYEAFRREKNVKPSSPIPADWLLFAGIDIGSGGSRNHPAAITFIAVDPKFQRGRVIYCWKGNKDEETSNADILNKYNDLRFSALGGRLVTATYYDWAAKDFGITATRANVHGLIKAEKDRNFGVSLINTLFKTEMMSIDDIPENYVLINELETLQAENRKTSGREDDACDSFRYSVSKCPWDYTHITVDKSAELYIPKPNKRPETREEIARAEIEETKNADRDMEEDFYAWNSFYEED
jgi:hypothetical protein